jgi:hypothetical protein
VSQGRLVGGFADADVTEVSWVTDDRLVYVASQRQIDYGEGGSGTFAVNHDGSDPRQLIAWTNVSGNMRGSNISSKILPYLWVLHSVPGDGSNDVFVARRIVDAKEDVKDIQLARLNTLTRELRSLDYVTPEYTSSVKFDSARELRMVTTSHAGRSKIFWRAAAGGAWVEVADFDPLNEGFAPWYVDANGQVLVQATLRDTEALHRFDPVAKKLDPEPLIQVKGFDLDSASEIDRRTRRLMGLHFVADRPMSYWFDEGVARIQASVDAALPAGRSNRLYCGECETTPSLSFDRVQIASQASTTCSIERRATFSSSEPRAPGSRKACRRAAVFIGTKRETA